MDEISKDENKPKILRLEYATGRSHESGVTNHYLRVIDENKKYVDTWSINDLKREIKEGIDIPGQVYTNSKAEKSFFETIAKEYYLELYHEKDYKLVKKEAV